MFRNLTNRNKKVVTHNATQFMKHKNKFGFLHLGKLHFNIRVSVCMQTNWLERVKGAKFY